MFALLVITGKVDILFNILLHHGGFLADINAVQELSDVLLSDGGGLLDQRCCRETGEPQIRAETYFKT